MDKNSLVYGILILTLFLSLLILFAVLLIKVYVDRIRKYENEEIDNEVNNVVHLIDDQDVLSLMIKNVAELREYYVINKQQARRSFMAALIICILGFLLFAVGIILIYVFPKLNNIIPYTTIAGVTVEIISGLFFWLYSKAITQINLFHDSLQRTEKFLTAIQLVDKISIEKKDEVYKSIIEKIINSRIEIIE